MRLLDMLLGRRTSPPDDERSTKDAEIEELRRRSDATLSRAAQALNQDQELARALSKAGAALRRSREGS